MSKAQWFLNPCHWRLIKPMKAKIFNFKAQINNHTYYRVKKQFLTSGSLPFKSLNDLEIIGFNNQNFHALVHRRQMIKSKARREWGRKVTWFEDSSILPKIIRNRRSRELCYVDQKGGIIWRLKRTSRAVRASTQWFICYRILRLKLDLFFTFFLGVYINNS